MLMFREEKSPDDEIKAWQFWHSRQHSVKQRILDAGKHLYRKGMIWHSILRWTYWGHMYIAREMVGTRYLA